MVLLRHQESSTVVVRNWNSAIWRHISILLHVAIELRVVPDIITNHYLFRCYPYEAQKVVLCRSLDALRVHHGPCACIFIICRSAGKHLYCSSLCPVDVPFVWSYMWLSSRYQWNFCHYIYLLFAAFKKVIEHNKDHFEDGISVERQMALERKKKRDERRAEAEAVTQRLFEQANLLKDHAKLLEQERLVIFFSSC